jgi:cell division protein FtsW
VSVTSIAGARPRARSRKSAQRSAAANLLALISRPQAPYYLVIGTATALLILGLIMVLSASSVTSFTASGSSFTIAARQALWIVIGIPVLLVGASLPVKAYRMLAYPLMAVSIFLLCAVLMPGVGQNVSGATRWIALGGGFQLQPSEPAKLALVLWGADLLARKEKRLDEPKHLLVPLLPMALLMALLVMAEPDMGTTIVLMLVLLALLFTAGAPLGLFAKLGLSLGGLAAILAITEPYRMQRLVGFRDPCAQQHALSVGYQACQGLYALSSGGWFGVGLGGSREKFGYLPNTYTDYIFAIIGEELGLLGTLLVLALFGLLAYAAIRIAQRCKDRFSQLAVAGVTAWLLGQALVNMGAVVGLLPITGIPLPLVSFGGSALLPTMFAIGMLISFARREPATAKALAAKRAAKGRGTARPTRRPVRAR